MEYFAHESSHIDPNCKIGKDSQIGAYCKLEKNVILGEKCKLGNYVRLAENVQVKDRVEISDHVTLFKGINVEERVFIGPSTVFTNILNPRADRQESFQQIKPTLLKKGCTTGANTTILAGVTLGMYSFIAAGAVVLKDVGDYELMVGVPAKRIGWMSRHGGRLFFGLEGRAKCPESGEMYQLEDGKVTLVEDQKS